MYRNHKMLKVLSEDVLINDINTSSGFKIEVDGKLTSNMIMYNMIGSTASGEHKFLVYRRPHKDSIYHNKWSIGYGGSMELVDIISNQGIIDKYNSLLKSGIREVNEEVTLSTGYITADDISLIGFIDGHLKAIVGHIKLSKHASAEVNLPENEGLGWFSLDDLIDHLDRFEPWSQEVIEGLSYLLDRPSTEAADRTTWRTVPGYKRYEVNAKGELRNKKTNRISQGGDAGRYLKVSVYPDGASEPHLEYLHILVCKAYHGLPNKGQVVKHKNNIRSDVRPSNLSWGTQSDNIREAHADGLIK